MEWAYHLVERENGTLCGRGTPLPVILMRRDSTSLPWPKQEYPGSSVGEFIHHLWQTPFFFEREREETSLNRTQFPTPSATLAPISPSEMRTLICKHLSFIHSLYSPSLSVLIMMHSNCTCVCVALLISTSLTHTHTLSPV